MLAGSAQHVLDSAAPNVREQGPLVHLQSIGCLGEVEASSTLEGAGQPVGDGDKAHSQQSFSLKLAAALSLNDEPREAAQRWRTTPPSSPRDAGKLIEVSLTVLWADRFRLAVVAFLLSIFRA